MPTKTQLAGLAEMCKPVAATSRMLEGKNGDQRGGAPTQFDARTKDHATLTVEVQAEAVKLC